MLYQKDSVPDPGGAVKVWAIDESPLVGDAEPRSAAYDPECAPEEVTPVAGPDDVQPERLPASKPPLVIPPPPDEETSHEKDAEPDAPVVSVAFTVTDEVPAVVGVPVISP